MHAHDRPCSWPTYLPCRPEPNTLSHILRFDDGAPGGAERTRLYRLKLAKTKPAAKPGADTVIAALRKELVQAKQELAAAKERIAELEKTEPAPAAEVAGAAERSKFTRRGSTSNSSSASMQRSVVGLMLPMTRSAPATASSARRTSICTSTCSVSLPKGLYSPKPNSANCRWSAIPTTLPAPSCVQRCCG